MIIDRFEGEYAIIEIKGETLDMPRKILPANAEEGDIIEIKILKEETDERRKRIESKFKELLK